MNRRESMPTPSQEDREETEQDAEETNEEKTTREKNPAETLEERGVPGGKISSGGATVEVIEDRGFDPDLVEKQNKEKEESAEESQETKE